MPYYCSKRHPVPRTCTFTPHVLTSHKENQLHRPVAITVISVWSRGTTQRPEVLKHLNPPPYLHMSLPGVTGFFTPPTWNLLPSFKLSQLSGCGGWMAAPSKACATQRETFIWKRQEVDGCPVSADAGPSTAPRGKADRPDSSELPLSFTCSKVWWNFCNAISFVSLVSTRWLLQWQGFTAWQKWQLPQPSCKPFTQSTHWISKVPLNL